MTIYTPNFGMKAPSGATKLRHLGPALEEFARSVDSTLAEFDYNGADPNLVLARVLALETQVAAMTRTTGWIPLRTMAALSSSWSDTANTRAEICRIGNTVKLRGRLTNASQYNEFSTSGTLPPGFRPSQQTPSGSAWFAIPSATTATKTLRVIAGTGVMSWHSTTANSAWAFDGITWETDEAWPFGY